MNDDDVERIKNAWQRIFGMDVEAVRKRRGFSSLAENLRALEKYQADPAHVDKMLKEVLSKKHGKYTPEFSDDQTDFWDPELNDRIKKFFDSEKAAPPVSAEAWQEGGTGNGHEQRAVNQNVPANETAHNQKLKPDKENKDNGESK
jgi:hypothetical protein